MIKSWAHKGLEKFFVEGSKKGISPEHADRLDDILTVLNTAKALMDINLPGLRLHALKGALKGLHSVTVSGNWRVTFRFENGDTFEVDYLDYH